MAQVKEDSLAKNVADIVQKTYLIPFYQRNYNWGNNEITQFIQDIYESYVNNRNQNYYIGSLVVFGRRENSTILEVIDGQQRLTTLHILSRIFPHKDFKAANLKYDSRPEVESFFDRLDVEKIALQQLEEDLAQSNLTNFFKALDTIVNVRLDSEIDSVLSFEKLEETNGLSDFIEYFYHKVMMVEVQMPPDTDVATYFEIMNNRGRQLQEHEILKAQFMSKINNPKERSIFGYVWDACSQMDRPLQKFFNSEQRAQLFGDSYDTIQLGNLKNLARATTKAVTYSILDILEKEITKTSPNSIKEHDGDLDQELSYSAIIDFSNFLIHILKLIYPTADIPLSSDKLLKIYKSISPEILDQVAPTEFLKNLLFYRVVFDRYLVKSAVGSENIDEQETEVIQESEGLTHERWMLTKPVMYMKNYAYRGKRYPSLNFKNTFDDPNLQERIIKLLSMLQVTYRQRKNKNYLQYILSLFDPKKAKSLDMNGSTFLKKLEEFTLSQFDKLEIDAYLEDRDTPQTEESDIYAEGTNTHHFLFNFIDYLLWVDKAWNKKDSDVEINFDFTYRNSIEHHLPQAQKHLLQSDAPENLIHCLGNLCLISKGANSKLNDRSAWDKATDPRYSGGVLTPKRKVMYAVTKKLQKWNAAQILDHYYEIINMLRNRHEILSGHA